MFQKKNQDCYLFSSSYRWSKWRLGCYRQNLIFKFFKFLFKVKFVPSQPKHSNLFLTGHSSRIKLSEKAFFINEKIIFFKIWHVKVVLGVTSRVLQIFHSLKKVKKHCLDVIVSY